MARLSCRILVLATLLGVGTGGVTWAAVPLGTAFTYQGQLKKAGEVVNDFADFEFRLFDAAMEGTQIGPVVTIDKQKVVDELFTVTLDFGVLPFTLDGNLALWLEITVRSPSGEGNFETLVPRQKLTPTPFSLATRGINVNGVGNVGIGVLAPTVKLDVLGNVRATTTSGTRDTINARNSGGTGHTIDANNSNGVGNTIVADNTGGVDTIVSLNGGGETLPTAGRAICAVANPPARGETIGADSGGAGPAIFARQTAAGDAIVARSGGAPVPAAAGRAILATAATTAEALRTQNTGAGDAITALASGGSPPGGGAIGRAVWADATAAETARIQNTGAGDAVTALASGGSPPGGGAIGRALWADATAAETARIQNSGAGDAITALASGGPLLTAAGRAICAVANPPDGSETVFAESADTGLGSAGLFITTNPANPVPALEGRTNSTTAGASAVAGIASAVTAKATYGVRGESKSTNLVGAGVLAVGNGCGKAAALEISNGAIRVTGDKRPVGTVNLSPPTTELCSCSVQLTCQDNQGGGVNCDPHCHVIGFYDEYEVTNCFIKSTSLVLLTMQAPGPWAYSAQVITLGTGTMTVQVTAQGGFCQGNGSGFCESGQCPGPNVNVGLSYLIINP